jgi:hypothetical protein
MTEDKRPTKEELAEILADHAGHTVLLLTEIKWLTDEREGWKAQALRVEKDLRDMISTGLGFRLDGFDGRGGPMYVRHDGVEVRAHGYEGWVSRYGTSMAKHHDTLGEALRESLEAPLRERAEAVEAALDVLRAKAREVISSCPAYDDLHDDEEDKESGASAMEALRIVASLPATDLAETSPWRKRAVAAEAALAELREVADAALVASIAASVFNDNKNEPALRALDRVLRPWKGVTRMSNHEAEAVAVSAQARREIRDAFQIRNPHYTPPPWADRETWERWVEANVNMHGVRGFYDRGMHLQIHESFSALTPPPSTDE